MAILQDAFALFTKLTALADAVRNRTGQTRSMTLDGIISATSSIGAGEAVDTADWKADIEGTWSGTVACSTSTPRHYMYCGLSNMTSFNFTPTTLTDWMQVGWPGSRLTTASFPNLTTVYGNLCIGDYYYSQSMNNVLATVSLPNLTSILCPASLSQDAFAQQTSLIIYASNATGTLSIPKLQTAGGVVIQCYNITSVYIPSYWSTGSWTGTGAGLCMSQCKNLRSWTVNASVKYAMEAFAGTGILSLPSTIMNKIPVITTSMFQNCLSLSTVSFSNAINASSLGGTGGNNSVFKGCTSLRSVYFGNAAANSTYGTSYVIGDSWFEGCTSLVTVSGATRCSTVGRYAFRGCTALTSIEFTGNIASISSYAFSGCTNLSVIKVKNTAYASSFVSLAGSTVFAGTKITSTTGSIYVATALVASYKTRAGWSYFSNRIVGY